MWGSSRPRTPRSRSAPTHVPEDLPGLPRENGLSPTARAAEAESRVRVYFEMLGFAFSRKRAVDGKTMLEFYLNLYQRPLIEPSESY